VAKKWKIASCSSLHSPIFHFPRLAGPQSGYRLATTGNFQTRSERLCIAESGVSGDLHESQGIGVAMG
ncbi:MAG: hypothetical protein KJO08_07765, partial [Gammaproteobacteria bacterium]|nr:hypothetical protein [Gammaproteobacteria bacterium]